MNHRRIISRMCVLGVLATVLKPAHAESVGRLTELLDGSWQRATVPASVDTPPNTGWETMNVPNTTFLTLTEGPRSLWYQRDITIPADLGDRRVFIDLRAARYQPVVFIDGKPITPADQSDGWSPQQVEITPVIKAGATHKLTIRCHDRSILLSPGFVVKEDTTNEQARGKTLGLVGGYKDNVGLGDHINLRITPAQCIDIDDFQLITSTRRGEIRLSGRVLGRPDGLEASAEVLDGSTTALRLPASALTKEGTFQLAAAFPDAKQWSPESPHLYQIRITLSRAGKVIDSHTQRFGFKEVWTDGPDFYLNGVKRRLLASSTWPGGGFEDPAEVRKRMKLIRDSNTIAFRLHIGGWQEDWYDAADELGVMIIPEAACYTDGDGMYAYKDPAFWRNYERHIAGMIRRDRNRASVIMFSLGNEILFMGNKRHDADLPKKLGDLARFARALNPFHPLTMEADLDPDNAFDIVGLHYPHEMPSQRAYPNTADWLDRAKNTEASGGMLGQQGTDSFLWDRKKPLYIGEYLWTPHGDYSNSTIWFGDDAFLHRERLHGEARVLAWTDQTLGYRRAGVTGTCPWTVFGFAGVVKPQSGGYIAQTDYYKPQSAYWRERGLRFFAGDKIKLSFDVFNDSPAAADYLLRVRPTDPASPLKEQSTTLTLAPGEYSLVTLAFDMPAGREAEYPVVSELLASGKVVDTRERTLRTFLRKPIEAPPGLSLVVLDPSGKWPGSVRELPPAETLDVSKTVLLVAPHLIPQRQAGATPTIGATGPSLNVLHAFLRRGGRCVILEQSEVAVLGLGLSSVEFPSTMTFPLRADHPLLTGLVAGDLKYWAPDNYVTAHEVVRPASGGARAIVVSGGTEWLSSAPVVDVPYGRGRVILVQTLAGARRDVEPAAALLIQNAVNLLAASPATPQTVTRVVSNDATFAQALSQLGLVTSASASAPAGLLILHGGGSEVTTAANQARLTLAAGGTVYWHAPTPEAFRTLASTLEADELFVEPRTSGMAMLDRANPLLDGISREDFVASTAVTGWNRQMSPLANASLGFLQSSAMPSFAPISLAAAELDSAKASGGAIRFDRRASAELKVTAKATGIHGVRLKFSSQNAGKVRPLVMVEVNGVETTCLQLDPANTDFIPLQAHLRVGENSIKVQFVNGAQYGSSRTLSWEAIELSTSPVLPSRFESLTVPATIITWRAGPGRVVIDQLNWREEWPGVANPLRYASALFANLGAAFTPPEQSGTVDSVPLPAFELVGESPYFSRTRDRIAANSNAVLRTNVQCSRAGRFVARIRGSGSQAGGEFPHIRILVNGKQVGEVYVNSTKPIYVDTPAFALPAGKLDLQLIYDNDAIIGGNDRNLVIQGVSFIRQD